MPVKEAIPPIVPEDLNFAIKSGKVRAPTHIVSTICDDRGTSSLCMCVMLSVTLINPAI